MAPAPAPAAVDLADVDLAAGFEPATRERWLELVDRGLKGRDRAELATRLADGIEVLPLYAGADAGPAGALPFAPRDTLRPWDVRTLVAHPDPARANTQALDDLEGGAASILLRFDPAGRRGLVGVDADVLARVLEGVHTDLAPVALDAGSRGVEAAHALSAAAGRGPAAPLAFHMDPLGAAALEGAPSDGAVAAAARAGAELLAIHPRATLMRAGGEAVHEAGGTEAQELGFAAACGWAYVRALDEAGVDRGAAFAAVVLGVAADPRLFVTIAKLRALRLIWARLAAAGGVDALARIEARGARRTLSRLDPWTNLLRLASAAAGAALGGADALVLPPFTIPLTEGGEATDTAFARRQARNIQLVLMEEAHLGRVVDPAAGSGLVERLTEAFARAGWAELQRLEAAGGVARALPRFAEEVGGARNALQARLDAGEDVLVGATVFPDRTPTAVEVEPLEATGPAASAPAGPLAPVRLAWPAERAEAAA